jgi:uncharacterized protein (UPF0332 family)
LTPEVRDLWGRATRTLRTARVLIEDDPDSAASRAYYAAYYAVSALFESEGKTFRKHTAVEAAVHRDLVKAGRWGKELGEAFSDLAKMRATADYGSIVHIAPDEAASAVAKAERIVVGVRLLGSDALSGESE